jgi:aminoglycoside phosphotransferase (APT) family kinase protein
VSGRQRAFPPGDHAAAPAGATLTTTAGARSLRAVTQNAQPQDVGPVAERHRFDEQSLARYLEQNLDGYRGPLTVRQFAGGQSNPTFFLTAGERSLVLRKKPPGQLLPSAHAVDREFKVIRALGTRTDFPVPRAHLLCEDASVIGTIFYVMDWVPGRIFRDPMLPGMDPGERGAIYDAMNAAMAHLHTIDPFAIGLADFGKPGNYFDRQTARWIKQYEASKTEEIESFDRLVEWLPKSIPAGNETRIAHGDFRLENMVIHPTEPRVLAVLDWELSTLGHPLADLGYNVMGYFAQVGPTPHLGGVDLQALGIPSCDEYVAAYCRRTGRERIDDLEFYVVFALFRSAAIMQGIAMRAKIGTASSANAEMVGKLARAIADTAWDLVQRTR